MTELTLAPDLTATDIARSRLLLHASEALSATATVADVLAAVATLPERGLGAGHIRIVLAGDDPDPVSERAIRQRRALYFADRTELAAAYPSLEGPVCQALACVPLAGDAGVAGVLQIAWDAPRMFYVGERAMIATLAVYITQALERARRLDARIGVADVLQRAMLSTLPSVDRYELAARYLPADTREKVGGDWYDAVPGAGGRITLVIGDVVGHDMAAAARMGQLRSMLRAYLVDRHEPPSALLRRLDAANHALGDPSIATAVVAVVDELPTGGHRLRWSNAGHPPPVLIHSDGAVQPLTGNDMLLGARRFVRRHTYAHELPAGSTVLLHTDGLVERPGQTIDDGFAQLHRRLRSARRSRLDDLLADAAGEVRGERTDDVAMLAIRIPAEG